MTVQINRRGILGMVAAGVGAAIVRSGLLMPIKPRLVQPVPLISGDSIYQCVTSLPTFGDVLTFEGCGGVTGPGKSLWAVSWSEATVHELFA